MRISFRGAVRRVHEPETDFLFTAVKLKETGPLEKRVPGNRAQYPEIEKFFLKCDRSTTSKCPENKTRELKLEQKGPLVHGLRGLMRIWC